MFNLPKLSYSYDELNDFISADALNLHYEKHHQTYLDKLNNIIAKEDWLSGLSIEDIFKNIDRFSVDDRQLVNNFGGGYYNHNFFWDSVSPSGGGEPSGLLAELINDKYGDYKSFIDEFTSISMGVFGSGWTWLLSNGDIVKTSNQDRPTVDNSTIALLCLDLWEHSYYLDYKNRRDDYIRAWWNVVNWPTAEIKYSKHISSLA